MKLLTEFVIKGVPETATAQQKQYSAVAGKVVVYEKKAVKEAKEKLFWQFYPYCPEKPYGGKLCIRLMWLFDKKSLTKKENMTFNSTRPDLDNLAKGCLDVMQKAGLIAEDSIICKLDLSKAWWKEYTGLFVQIWQVDDSVDFEPFVTGWRDRIT